MPRSLAAIVPGLPRQIEVEGSTVAEVIDALDHRWPGMAARLVEAGPAIRAHINVFVDGERAALDRALEPGSAVHIIPAVAGG